MAEIIEKDMLTIENGVICHSCNTMGKMGAGIALSIRRKFPIVYKKYMNAYDTNKLKLGTIQIVEVDDELYVCNMFTQKYYGRSGMYVNYDAFRECVKKINSWANDKNIQIYFPFKISSTLAGGDWNIILQIITEEAYNSIICKFGEYR